MAKVAVIAVCKREERYINEWLDWNINIGVEHFYLIDNNDEECGNSLERTIHYPDKVTIFNKRGMEIK